MERKEIKQIGDVFQKLQISDLVCEEILNKDLICVICQDLVTDPVECSKCEHVFCKVCIIEWQKLKNKCPFDCKVPLTLTNIHRFTKAIIQKLLFKCRLCKTQFYHDEHQKHLNICPDFPEVCPNLGCKLRIKRKLMKEHLENNCKFNINKKINCSNCEKLVFQIADLNKLIHKNLILFEKQQNQNEVQFCKSNKHQIQLYFPAWGDGQEFGNRMFCSKCKNQKQLCRYVCKSCQEFYCIQCYPLKFTPTLCPFNHRLMPQCSDKIVCDVCETQQKRGDATMSCEKCNLDICIPCFKKIPLN